MFVDWEYVSKADVRVCQEAHISLRRAMELVIAVDLAGALASVLMSGWLWDALLLVVWWCGAWDGMVKEVGCLHSCLRCVRSTAGIRLGYSSVMFLHISIRSTNLPSPR